MTATVAETHIQPGEPVFVTRPTGEQLFGQMVDARLGWVRLWEDEPGTSNLVGVRPECHVSTRPVNIQRATVAHEEE